MIPQALWDVLQLCCNLDIFGCNECQPKRCLSKCLSDAEPSEKPKSGSEEDLLLKKLKKKKKKKHKDGERVKERHSRPKMYHRSSQTVCSGVHLALPDFLTRINSNNSINSSSGALLHNTTAVQHQNQHQQDSPLPANTSASVSSTVRDRLCYSSPLHCTPVPSLPGLEFSHLIHIEQQANGGASLVHAYSDQLARLSPAEMQRFAEEFVSLSFSEDEGQAACFVMGIIHGAASYLPDFLDYFSYKFPNAPVKMEVLGKKDIETTTMINFHSQVSFALSPKQQTREECRLSSAGTLCIVASSSVCSASRHNCRKINNTALLFEEGLCCLCVSLCPRSTDLSSSLNSSRPHSCSLLFFFHFPNRGD